MPIPVLAWAAWTALQADPDAVMVSLHSDHRVEPEAAFATLLRDAVRIARETGCNAVHPGYGFLSENPKLATACAAGGLIFIGPDAELLEL